MKAPHSAVASNSVRRPSAWNWTGQSAYGKHQASVLAHVHWQWTHNGILSGLWCAEHWTQTPRPDVFRNKTVMLSHLSQCHKVTSPPSVSASHWLCCDQRSWILPLLWTSHPHLPKAALGGPIAEVSSQRVSAWGSR